VINALNKVIVVQRETLEWCSLDLEKFKDISIEHSRRWGKPDDFTYILALLWNSTFGVDFFETRYRLKMLSESHNESLPGVTFLKYHDGRELMIEDAVYTFVDDDDWYSPDLGSVLGGCAPNHFNILLWLTTNVGSPNQPRPIFYWDKNGRCMTNNYAASGQWFKKNGSMACAYSDGAALRSVEAQSSVEQIELRLSVSNKGPISSVSMHKGLGNSREPQALLALVENYLYRMSSLVPSDISRISWSSALIDKTIQIYQDVYDSRLVELHEP
jgi:hypothetical protein